MKTILPKNSTLFRNPQRNFVLINRKRVKFTFYLCRSVTAEEESQTFVRCEVNWTTLFAVKRKQYANIEKYSVYNSAAARKDLSETFARHSAKQTPQTATHLFNTGLVLNG